MSILVVRDATHDNVSALPPGHVAGYTTGSADIKWTDADWHAHPGALRICQDFGASDVTADYLDVERGAATNDQCPGWVKKAQASYHNATRPGQRSPAIYTSASNVTPLVNALIAGGVKGGVGLVVANWNLTQAEAAAQVIAAAGPFPIVGIQFASLARYDVNVFSSAWVNEVSKPHSHRGGAPRRLVADGHTSLREVVKADGTGVPAALWETAQHEPGGFGRLQADYIRAGNWDAPMPSGTVVWLP